MTCSGSVVLKARRVPEDAATRSGRAKREGVPLRRWGALVVRRLERVRLRADHHLERVGEARRPVRGVRGIAVPELDLDDRTAARVLGRLRGPEGVEIPGEGAVAESRRASGCGRLEAGAGDGAESRIGSWNRCPRGSPGARSRRSRRARPWLPRRSSRARRIRWRRSPTRRRSWIGSPGTRWPTCRRCSSSPQRRQPRRPRRRARTPSPATR